MKKFCSLIMILLLLLGSCSPNSVEDDTSDDSGNAVNEDTGTTVDSGLLEELNFNPEEGVSFTTLEHTADITSFKSFSETASVSMAPVVYSDGQYTYIFRKFPEELTGADNVMEYIMNKDIAEINEIEIYENHSYSEPVEVITLDAMAEKSFTPYSLSYNSDKDEFYIYISESGDPTFYTFSRQGDLLNRYVLSVDRLNELLCLDGKLYVINNKGYQGSASSLSVVDPATDEETVLDEGVIDFYTENGLLYYIKNAQTSDYNNIQRICCYDPATGDTATVKEMQTDELIVSVYYDAANDTVYFSSTYELFAYKDGKTMPVIDSYNANVMICEADSEHIYTRIGSNQISVYQLPDEPDSIENYIQTLNVCIFMDTDTFKTQVSSAVDLMAAAGIPIRFKYTYVADDQSDLKSNEDEYVNTMAKKFLAEDSDYDLFMLSSTMSELFTSKYYEDFSDYPVIMDYYDKLINGMTELCSIDGKLALAPVYLCLDSMIFDPFVLYDPDDAPKTFEEFFDKYDEVSEDMSGDSYYCVDYDGVNFIYPWLEELASNYLAEIISEETAQNDLIKLFDCVAELDEYERIYLGPESENKSVLFSFGINTGNHTSGEYYSYTALPELSEGYKNSVDGIFIGVNPKSTNKELALTLISYYLNSIINGDFVNVMQFVKQGEVGASEDAVSSEVDYNSSKYKAFAEQIANSIHKTTADNLLSFARDLCLQIEDGTVTPEEAASRTLRYLKMMRDE